MLIVPPTLRKQSRRRRPPLPPVVAPALTLVAASLDRGETEVTLQFDRAIDIASMDASAIQVGSVVFGNLYQGGGGPPTPVDPSTVRVPLAVIGSYAPANVELFATAGTGIVAADDGGTWAGADGLGLPFP